MHRPGTEVKINGFQAIVTEVDCSGYNPVYTLVIDWLNRSDLTQKSYEFVKEQANPVKAFTDEFHVISEGNGELCVNCYQLMIPFPLSIWMVDPTGNIIKRFSSLSEAERGTGWSRGNISRTLNSKTIEGERRRIEGHEFRFDG